MCVNKEQSSRYNITYIYVIYATILTIYTIWSKDIVTVTMQNIQAPEPDYTMLQNNNKYCKQNIFQLNHKIIYIKQNTNKS